MPDRHHASHVRSAASRVLRDESAPFDAPAASRPSIAGVNRPPARSERAGVRRRLAARRGRAATGETPCPSRPLRPCSRCGSCGRSQRRPRRRADGRGVKVVVAQPSLGEPIEGPHVDRAAEAGRVSEPHVVDQGEDDIGCPCPLGWLQLEAGRRRGLTSVDLSDRWILPLRKRQIERSGPLSADALIIGPPRS